MFRENKENIDYILLIKSIEKKFYLFRDFYKNQTNLEDLIKLINEIIHTSIKLQKYEKIEHEYNNNEFKKIHFDNFELLKMINLEVNKKIPTNESENFIKNIKEGLKKEDEAFTEKIKMIFHIEDIFSKIIFENEKQLKILMEIKNKTMNEVKLKESLINEYRLVSELNESLKTSNNITLKKDYIEEKIITSTNPIINYKKQQIRNKKDLKKQIKENKKLERKNKNILKNCKKEEKIFGTQNSFLIKDRHTHDILKSIDFSFSIITKNNNFDLYWQCIPIVRNEIAYSITEISRRFNKKISELFNIELKDSILVITDTIRSKETQEKYFKTNPNAINPEKSKHVSGFAIDIGLNSTTNKLRKILKKDNNEKNNKIIEKISFKILKNKIKSILNSIVNDINKEYSKDLNNKPLFFAIIENNGCFHISLNQTIEAKRITYNFKKSIV
ncbi:MAG: hypothetical protein PHT94_01215 [Candidatus Nanoarchaeia archaeon]|nr:hypothetical protein [Candidatus Nanoarchaeia archaeon]